MYRLELNRISHFPGMVMFYCVTTEMTYNVCKCTNSTCIDVYGSHWVRLLCGNSICYCYLISFDEISGIQLHVAFVLPV